MQTKVATTTRRNVERRYTRADLLNILDLPPDAQLFVDVTAEGQAVEFIDEETGSDLIVTWQEVEKEKSEAADE